MNLRKKMVIGVVGFSIMVGSGTALASTDAGQQLQNWYNKQFTVASSEVKTGVENHAKGLIPSLISWFNGVKSDATKNIEDNATTEIDRAANAINSAKDGYIEEISETKDSINSGMAAQFDSIYSKAQEALDKEAQKYAKIAKDDVTKSLNTTGAAQVKNVENDVNIVKEAAKDALTLAINDTKTELQGNIDTERNATITEINNYIDARIVTEKEILTSTVDDLKATNKAAIELKGSQIEATAISELDAMVDAIDN